jgi:hypothetical protein
LSEKKLPEGEHYYKVFHCYGCQSCFQLMPDDSLSRSPHVLSSEDVTEEIRQLKLSRAAIKHVGQCATDPIAEQVCNAIYQERTDDNLGLCEALRAIYALCGEDEQIVKIINDALQDYGVGEA